MTLGVPVTAQNVTFTVGSYTLTGNTLNARRHDTNCHRHRYDQFSDRRDSRDDNGRRERDAHAFRSEYVYRATDDHPRCHRRFDGQS